MIDHIFELYCIEQVLCALEHLLKTDFARDAKFESQK